MRFFKASLFDVKRIEECARLCCEAHGTGVTGGELNWAHYREAWQDLIRSGLGVMFLYEDGGRIVGGIGGAMYPEMLTGHLRCGQLFIYVLPEYRGKISVARMMRALERWAREEGCCDITQPHLDTMPKATVPVYERMGYRKLQSVFVKDL